MGQSPKVAEANRTSHVVTGREEKVVWRGQGWEDGVLHKRGVAGPRRVQT